MEQRTAMAAAVETETSGSDFVVETPEITTVEMPKIAAGENLTTKSEGK